MGWGVMRFDEKERRGRVVVKVLQRVFEVKIHGGSSSEKLMVE